MPIEIRLYDDNDREEVMTQLETEKFQDIKKGKIPTIASRHPESRYRIFLDQLRPPAPASSPIRSIFRFFRRKKHPADA